MKRLIFALFAAAVGCSPNESLVVDPIEIPIVRPAKPSYEISDLCDTTVEERDFTLHVYIHPSESLWDFHQYKDELSGYVKKFFAQYKVNCIIEYSDSKFEPFTSPNEIGIEILESGEAMAERYFEFFPPKNEEEKYNQMSAVAHQGYMISELGIALINGDWGDPYHVTKEELKENPEKPYSGMTILEYVLKQNAATLYHETMHGLGLLHPRSFIPSLVYADEHNAMAMDHPAFVQDLVSRNTLTWVQIKLMHSSLAGNNTYRAFLDSNRDLELFEKRLARANQLKIR